MIRHGDELGLSQDGNNNAYCQDNRSPGSTGERGPGLPRLLRRPRRFPNQHPVFWRRRFFEGEPIFGGELSDISWFGPDRRGDDGRRLAAGFAKSLSVFLNGEALPDPDRAAGGYATTASCCWFNAHHETSRSCCRARSGAGGGRPS